MLPILTIPGYDINTVIDEGLNTIVYRGLSQTNLEPVILKVLKAEYPTLEQIARIKHEYSITANLDLEGVVTVLRLETYENRLLLVLEDFGGMSLKQYLNGEKLSLSIFLKIALQVVKSLISLHNHRIIHKDIKPSNIIINPESLECKITDFSIGSRYQETLQPLNINQLEGTLAYISPEQTGRMNRGVDYRSDFYNLGITFYEMLTGKLPFASDDPLELIHCHIAKEAPLLKVESEEIPQVICDIVAKLMAKNAEDRYQSAGGLLADLETCYQQFQTTGIVDFLPGLYDSSAQLNIPEKLYGREEEVTALLTAFERVAGGTSEIILVSGYSGIGKSSLVNEVHKPIVREKGYFISGKFDQLGRTVPYASVIQAFQSLMQQLLTENVDKLLIWKEKLLSALGTNGQVIINVIPELELIIGKQPKLTQLAASEEQNRFNRVFEQFIRVFTQPQHPLVLFLDDLQWADSASLKLLEVLTTSIDIKYFLLIGAYRDNEVSFTHPLVKTLSEIEKDGTTINNIVLRPLMPIHIQQIIVDTLKPDSVFGVSQNREGKVEEIKEFAELLFNKTQGNPFFLSQLLKTLYQENLLVFDFYQGQWVWNIQDILHTGIADKSVVELVAGNIEKLPEDTQQLLKYAACIGARFSEYLLATVSNAGNAKFSVSTILQPALQQGLVLPLNNEYKVSLLFDQEELKAFGFDDNRVTYRFLHDRVQQAAYSLIADDEKKETHLRIGRLLLQNTPKEQLDSNVIFDIVNQLNVGIDTLTQESEKDELAKLNLIAGRKAKAAAAFEEAFKYLNVGLELLLADSWHNEYELTLGLYSSAVEAAYLTAKLDLMEEWANIVLQQAKTILDKVKIYEIKIQSYIAQGKFIEAINLGLEILEFFEIKLPKTPTPLNIQEALLETATFLEGKCIEDLINLPLMSDNRKLAAMRILASIATPSVIAMPALFPITILTQVQLSIQYGNAPFSAFSYVCYGMILQSVNDIDASYQFGNLALNLAKQLNFLEIKAKTFHVVAVSAIHIKEHVLRVLPLLQEAYSTGIENGDLEFASCAAMQRCQYSYFAGLDLASLEQEIAAISHDLTKFGQITALNLQKILQQVVLNLLGQADESCLLVGMWNEQTMLPLFLAANDRASLYFFYIHKLILCYLFGEYAQAVEKTEYVFQYLDTLPGHLHVQISYFYDSLARLAVYPHDFTQQQEILAKVQANQEKMQLWAQHAPMNFQHKYDLVEAEKYCVLGQNYQAMDFYDRAIAGAVENRYIQEEALANERAALFYLALGKQKIAKTYMTDAYYGYIKWGALAKVRDLEKRYPTLIIRNTPQTEDKYKTTITATIASTTISTTNTSQILDLATVIKAGTAINREINLDNLSLTLLHIILENAGAQKGCLILEKDNQFFVEAIHSSDSHQIQQSIPIAECFDIPQKLINYITKTQEALVIQDATINPIANTDPYIQQHQCKSILCVPIISQGQLIGIFYLENNLVRGAFTPVRLELIKILSSQAAMLKAGRVERGYYSPSLSVRSGRAVFAASSSRCS